MMRALGLVALAAFVSTPASAQRLPTGVEPLHYRIALSPAIARGDLAGDETITVRIVQPTRTIVLNSVGLDLSRVMVGSGAARQRATVSLDPAAETATLQVATALPTGSADIDIAFSGRLRTDLRGLYVSRTARRAYAVTQFEGTYARMAFPCFDEPAHKATFDLSVVVDHGDSAISNGRIVSDTPGPVPGKHTIRFSRSPKMSSYLVALAIGDFQCLEGGSDGIPIRVCAVPEKKDLGAFALHAAERFMHWYNQWYGVTYPFGKLDMLAMPDYEWGGMENTASIFYRDSALLLDDASASVDARRRVAAVVAHEMAHQWFGDLVTMRWWDDVWLNEGFATWMERKPLQAWDPAWNQEVDATASASRVLELDSARSTRAIRAKAETPAEIKEMFDGITYEKGAAVLRMLEGYLGEEPFRAGVNAYLVKYRDGSATAEDLWRELAAVSRKPAQEVMAGFIDQPGAPLVSAEVRCENGRRELVLRQRRLFNSARALAETSPEHWHIPVCTRAAGAASSSCVVLSQEEQRFPLETCEAGLILNAEGRGYYRSEYPTAVVQAMSAGIEGKLSPAERIGVLADLWALVRVGKARLVDFLEMADGLRSERERAVLESLIDKVVYVRERLTEGVNRQAYDRWMIRLLGPAAADLGWQHGDGDSDDRRSLRASVFGAMGLAGDANTVAFANEVVRQYSSDPAGVDATLVNAAFEIAADRGGAALYDDWLARLQKEGTPEEHDRLLFSLASFTDRALVKRSLDLWFTPIVREQDLPRFVAAMISNPSSRDDAWATLKQNWPRLHDKVVSFGGRGAVPALAAYCDEAARDDIARFFATNEAPGAQLAVKRALERIDDCVEMKALQKDDLGRWLSAR
jgi:aminopeptidase N